MAEGINYPGYTPPAPFVHERSETTDLIEAHPRRDVVTTENIATEDVLNSLAKLQLTLRKLGRWRKIKAKVGFGNFRLMVEESARLRYQADMLDKRVNALYRKWLKQEEEKRAGREH